MIYCLIKLCFATYLCLCSSFSSGYRVRTTLSWNMTYLEFPWIINAWTLCVATERFEQSWLDKEKVSSKPVLVPYLIDCSFIPLRYNNTWYLETDILGHSRVFKWMTVHVLIIPWIQCFGFFYQKTGHKSQETSTLGSWKLIIVS